MKKFLAIIIVTVTILSSCGDKPQVIGGYYEVISANKAESPKVKKFRGEFRYEIESVKHNNKNKVRYIYYSDKVHLIGDTIYF